MISKLIISVLLLFGTVNADTLTVDKDRTIRIIGEVDEGMLGVIPQLDDLSSKSNKPIYLLINSPGGSVFVGNLVINAMVAARSRGVKFHCVSTMFAASMAFQFYVECDKRYALRHTKLLFHPPRIFYQGVLLKETMQSWIQEIEHIEDKMVPLIQDKTGLADDVFQYHYKAETLWDAEDLRDASVRGFLSIIDDVRGIDNMFQVVPTFGNYQNGQLIWIHPSFMGGLGDR